MFVELFLQQLSASIARAGPKSAPSRDRRPREKSDGDKSKGDKKKVDKRRKKSVVPDQPLDSLAEELERLLRRNRPHQVPVLRARLGIDGPRTTLDAAARLAGMTRERARQIEVRFFVHFVGSPAATGLIERIERLRHVTAGPLFLRDLASRDPWFGGFAPESEVLLPLLEVASGSDLRFVKTPMGAVVAPRSIASWDELLDTAVKTVTHLGPGSNRHAVRKTVAGILKERKATELLEILLPVVELNIQYSSTGMLVGFGSTGPTIIEAILEDSDRPLHYTEIADRWSTGAGETIGPSTVLHAVKDSPTVYPLGRGIYGLSRHTGLEPAAIERLVADCEAIIVAVGPKQWHASELLEALRRNGRASVQLDKYVIEASLSRSSVLESLGRFVWAVRGARARMTSDRIDLHEAAIEVLERAGRPLHRDELGREIARSRGVAENFLIEPSERLVRTAPHTWGLVDRDFVLTEGLRNAVCDLIFEAVAKQRFALHSSELADVLRTIEIPEAATVYMIQQLAGRDPRLKLFKGGLIGLREWNNARRPSICAAMAQIEGSVQSPVTLDWLHAELEKSTGRFLPRASVYSVVRRSALVFDGETRTWRHPL